MEIDSIVIDSTDTDFGDDSDEADSLRGFAAGSAAGKSFFSIGVKDGVRCSALAAAGPASWVSSAARDLEGDGFSASMEGAGLVKPCACLTSGSGSAGWEDFRKASRDINPRCGVEADGDGAGDVLMAGENGAPGLGDVEGDLKPDESSAMILRIEARISSILGSAVDSSLDIPYLFRN